MPPSLSDPTLALACPICHAGLSDRRTGRWRCVQGHEFAVVNGLPVLLETISGPASSSASEFEKLYQDEAEPWSYTTRGAEIMKYQFTVETARGLCGGRLAGRTVVDVGCSLGGLAIALAEEGAQVLALDISQTAVRKSKAAFEAAGSRGNATFVVGSATHLPCGGGAADLIVLSDGLRSWQLDENQRQACLGSVARSLRKTGAALFLDYMHPRHFAGFIDAIDRGPLRAERVAYLGDRLFYKFERIAALLGLLPRSQIFRRLIASPRFARTARAVSQLAGPRGSKHLCVIARLR